MGTFPKHNKQVVFKRIELHSTNHFFLHLIPMNKNRILFYATYDFSVLVMDKY